jgi:phosphoserine phosphatase
MKDKIVVFDFDGTIIKLNSFRLYLLYLLLCFSIRFDVAAVLGLLKLFSLKVMGRVDHLTLKCICNKLGERLSPSQNLFFWKLMRFFFRPEIIAYEREYRKNDDIIIVIASAAPYVYMRYAKAFLPADIVVSYGDPGNETSHSVDNTGEYKLTNIANALGHQISRIQAVFSDHSNDIPLFRISDLVVVVKPTKRSEAEIKKQVSHYEVL